MRLVAAAGLVLLGLAVAPAPALAITCMFRPFQAAAERFGPAELVAHVEVLEVRADGTMDARVLRVLHGRQARPIISIDAAGSLGWNMPRQWGLESFTPGTQWVLVLLPARDGPAPWRLEVCRAFLKVESGHVAGLIRDLSRRERVPLDLLASRLASCRIAHEAFATCTQNCGGASNNIHSSPCNTCSEMSRAVSRLYDRAGYLP